MESLLIVIEHNGQRRVITGWRAWLIWLAIVIPAMLLLGAVVVALVCLILGVALTLTTIAIFALPLAFVLAVTISFFRAKEFAPKQQQRLP